MSKIFAVLIRHADYQQLPNTPSAHQPFGLSDKGFTQAYKSVSHIEHFCQQQHCQIDSVILSSKLLRAWQTAMAISSSLNDAKLTVKEHANLAERCVGSVANLSTQQIIEVVKQDPRYDDLPVGWMSNSHFCLPFQGAESLMDAGKRVASLLTMEMRSLRRQRADQLKIFVGHGAAFRHAAYYLGILNYEEITDLSMYHCGPIFIELQNDDRWQHISGEWKQRDSHSRFAD